MFYVHLCDEFRDLGADQGRTGARDSSLGSIWTGLHEREVPHSGRPSRDRGHHPKREEGKGTPGKRGMGKTLKYSGDATQQSGVGL